MDKCKYGCNKCLLFCTEGAKWTAVEFAEEAVRNGTTLLTHVTVRDVIVEDGIAGGVRARARNGQEYEIRAKVVVSSAGGMGTARILKRSGIYDAGNWFIGDPSIGVYGFVKEGPSHKDDLPMSAGWRDEERGVLFANLYMPRSMFAAYAFTGKRKLHELGNLLFRYGKGMGIFAKVLDDDEGRVYLEERKVSKTLTKNDVRKLEYGAAVCEKILIKAGCDPYNITHMATTLAHPGGTVKVGTLLDSNLETSIKNLYCCDTSVIPEGCGIPPVLTVVSLGKRLAKRLDNVLVGTAEEKQPVSAGIGR